jgi:hypothetical protein
MPGKSQGGGEIEMKRRFTIKDVAAYLRDGDYSTEFDGWCRDRRRGVITAYHPWGAEADPDIDYTEWLETVLIPSWQALEPVVCYDDGTVYGYSGNTTTDLDYSSGLTGELFDEYAEKFGDEIEEYE